MFHQPGISLRKYVVNGALLNLSPSYPLSGNKGLIRPAISGAGGTLGEGRLTSHGTLHYLVLVKSVKNRDGTDPIFTQKHDAISVA